MSSIKEKKLVLKLLDCTVYIDYPKIWRWKSSSVLLLVSSGIVVCDGLMGHGSFISLGLLDPEDESGTALLNSRTSLSVDVV